MWNPIDGSKRAAAGAEISTDGLGSVIAKVKGTADQPRIMVDAHLDEVGMMVRYITPDGYIKFQTLGGWLDEALIDQRWVIMTRKGPLQAVSGMPDAHLADSGEAGGTKQAFEHSKVFLDVGARSKEDAEALGIRPGDPIAPWSPFTILANNRYAAKAWDDRVGLVIQVEVLRRMKERGVRPPNTLYLTGTVQEEIGLRGAITTSHIVKPDLGIALEVGIAIDYPGPTPEQAEERLGGGPGIHLFDSSMLPNLKLRDFFFQVAADKRIPLQTDLVVRYGQDAAAMRRMEPSATLRAKRS
jgi:putative aminopeptidase FrvX